MNKKWRFDKNFLKSQLNEGKQLLKTMDKNSEDAENIMNMIHSLEELLGVKKEKGNQDYSNINLNNIIKNLNTNINDDLQLVTINEWRELKKLCEHMPKIHYKDINDSNLPKNNNCVLDSVLNFYRSIDLDIYYICRMILDSDYKLINFHSNRRFEKNGLESNYVISCEYLNLPFINISCKGDLKYPVTVHELRHAVNCYLYSNGTRTLLDELPSIYSEILFIDRINEFYDCKNLYNFRINDMTESLSRMIKYIDILERFDKCGRELDENNISDVLGLSSNLKILKAYKSLIRSPYLKGYDYIISTLLALVFREDYYNGYNVNEDMDKIMEGDKFKLNYDVMAEKYIDHANYVRSLSKK